jgi:molybdopterin/thiamine biosynthesis adenylyltransferase
MSHSISAGQADDHGAHAAVVLVGSAGPDRQLLADLRSDPTVEIRDLAPQMHRGLDELAMSPTATELAEEDRWVFYPWRRQLVSVLGPSLFRRLRLDRNRHKITEKEQEDLSKLTVGVAGLSVGHSIAYTIALEGLCGAMRIADFDVIELANLNRIPVGLLDIGVNKAVSLARRIAEVDPYLPVTIEPDGLTEKNIESFVQGLDLLVEECDSLDIKIRAREVARARRVPVLMETSDLGMFDAELFDVEPERPLLHGLLGDTDAGSLRGLSTHDKAPHVMRILEADKLSARMAATMTEIGRTVASWPQLAGDVQLGAATVAAAIRRYARGELSSGRLRIDLDRQLRAIGQPPAPETGLLLDEPDPAPDAAPNGGIEAVVHAFRIAPSGGNMQPWSIDVDDCAIEILVDRARSSAMDIARRGSYVAIGAGLFNARVAAAYHRLDATITTFPEGSASDVVASIAVAPGGLAGDGPSSLAHHYRAMLTRMTNRSFGRPEPISAELASTLAGVVAAEGARLVLVTDPDEIIELAEMMAESDRIRHLTPGLHESMMSEIAWPGRDRVDIGIDVRTLDLSPADLAKLQIAARSDVMGELASWNLGQALGDGTRDRIVTSSAVAVVVIDGDQPIDYVRGGSAVEGLWICAEEAGLGVHPVSPVFLYARHQAELTEIAPDFSTITQTLQHRFNRILALAPTEAPALVLRLSHHARPQARSRRMPRRESSMARAAGEGQSIE